MQNILFRKLLHETVGEEENLGCYFFCQFANIFI